MSTIVERNAIDDAVITCLKTNTGRPGDIGQPPTRTPSMPYIVLWPTSSPTIDSDWAEPYRDQGFIYDVHSVGATPLQAQWMADRVYRTMVERSGSAYAYDLPVTVQGHTVSIQWRTAISRGALMRSGDTLWEIVDRYEVRTSWV